MESKLRKKGHPAEPRSGVCRADEARGKILQAGARAPTQAGERCLRAEARGLGRSERWGLLLPPGEGGLWLEPGDGGWVRVSDSRHLLKAEPTGFADGWTVGSREKGGKGGPGFWPEAWKEGGAVYRAKQGHGSEQGAW